MFYLSQGMCIQPKLGRVCVAELGNKETSHSWESVAKVASTTHSCQSCSIAPLPNHICTYICSYVRICAYIQTQGWAKLFTYLQWKQKHLEHCAHIFRTQFYVYDHMSVKDTIHCTSRWPDPSEKQFRIHWQNTASHTFEVILVPIYINMLVHTTTQALFPSLPPSLPLSPTLPPSLSPTIHWFLPVSLPLSLLDIL